MNRQVRDPYAWWCERRTVGLWLTAVYSISGSLFFFHFVRCQVYVNEERIIATTTVAVK